MCKNFIGDEPFAVLLGDYIVYNDKTLCLKQLIDCYNDYEASVLGSQIVSEASINKYGIVGGVSIKDRVYKVEDLVERPSMEEALSNVAILGRYIIKPKIFEILDNTKQSNENEIQFTDALLKLNEEDMYVYDFKVIRYDAGDKLGFLEATVEYVLRKPELKEGFSNYLKTII